MSDINNSPVSLAAGSFDYDALKGGLDKAAKAKSDDYQEKVGEALGKAATTVHTNNDPRNIPGYKFVDVENKDLGVTETVQVFDPKLAEEQGIASGANPEAETATPARRTASKAASEE